VRQVGILHRDISIENIMVRRRGGEVHGVLNDFDLALDLRTEHDAEKSRKHITGTRLFMSCELLDPKCQEVHSGRHDLESLFWVVIWFIHRYQDGKECEPDHEGRRPLDDWLTTSHLAWAKRSFLVSYGELERPSVWEEAWMSWIRPLAKVYLNDKILRNELWGELKTAESRNSARVEEFINQNNGPFKDDLAAWRSFLKTITGEWPEDYEPNVALVCDLDDLSAIKF
jgi:serine/threonine protein kinase